MSLAAGTKLGPYEIVAPIGAGGMGEVYRARDTQLDREVAIKVLPAMFADDPERLGRFEREAKVLASLNHPNIASIYGVEERALVMEFVEGESPKGPMEFDDAWKVCSQIAAGLEYAHEKRVVHRDLKPANVKVTPDGRVKILDFGLAKALTADSARSASSAVDSPTLTMGATQAGVILGTAAYMAPEQVRGKEADRRADIWAFGLVLYELLTGERLFKGSDASETMARVLTHEPNLDRAPANVRRLLRECLKKDPGERLRRIEAAEYLLEKSGAGSPAQATSLPRKLPWALAAALAIVATVLAFVHFSKAPPETRLMTTTILPPESMSFDPSPAALSPDGRRIVFRARRADGRTQLWVRPLDSSAAQPLAGTENAVHPFWSPDSRTVAFFADAKLKRVEVAGGPALSLADAPLPLGGSWSTHGNIVFAPTFSGPLRKVAAAGGTSSQATVMTGSSSHRFPWFLPDGRHFLFEDQSQFGNNEVTLRIGTLDSQELKTVEPANSNAVYASGYLLYVRQSALMAQAFDAQRLAVTGDANPVAEQVRSTMTSGAPLGAFSVSRDGLLSFQRGTGATSEQLTWFDRSGKQAGTLGDPAEFFSLEFSPDRKSVAAARIGQNTDLWIYDVARAIPQRFTFGSAAHAVAVWSPDGRNVVYRSNPRGSFDLYRKAADGTGAEALLYADAALKAPTSWSPDGKFLLFMRYDPKTQFDIWALPLGEKAPPSKPFPWLATPFNDRFPQFSPDGSLVSYDSDEAGPPEVYVAPFPGPGGKRQISSGGGLMARWRADGKEIFYARLDGTLMAAEVSIKGATIEVGAVRSLNIPVITGLLYLYDISTDGQRFLVAAPRQQEASAPLTLVQNWTALVKRR